MAWPGFYDLRPDDTVLSLLDLATGGSGLDSLARVRLVRYRADAFPEIIEIDLPSMLRGESPAFPLTVKDHLSVYKVESATATIEGRVTFPDTYQIVAGITTLSELVEMAGGLLSDANVRTAVLERTGAQELGEVTGAKEFFKETEPERAVPAPFDFFAEGFELPFSGPKGSRVAVDIEGALSRKGEAIVLFDGDRVIFPRDDGTVFVTGHVSQPGYVAIREGESAKYYLARAGGAGPGATDVYVFEGSSGQARTGINQIVRSGDTIFVDRIEQVEVQTQQYRIQRVQTVVSSAATIAAIAATLMSLLRQ